MILAGTRVNDASISEHSHYRSLMIQPPVAARAKMRPRRFYIRQYVFIIVLPRKSLSPK